MNVGKKIGCIIVLYNPNMSMLFTILNEISNQVSKIYIVDNSTVDHFLDFSSYSNVVFEKLGNNIGIASAQNMGLNFFKDYEHILFLDQDSIPPRNLVSTLLENYLFLLNKNIDVGAVGPRPFNRGENKKYEGIIKKGKKLYNNITEVGELISSSSLIAVETFNKVGLLEDGLFIDAVDHEWCWRAKAVGNYRFFIIEDVLLSHQLGEGDKNFLGMKIHIPAPIRTYYQFRNYIKLLDRSYVPFYWKFSNGIKYFIKYFYYPVFVNNGKKYVEYMNRGISDGFKDKDGSI
ncbi:glycosyltransferase family 2 protein [Acinetobacter sp. VNH17]|uniref:Glycosyltransferase family 2 protein n=1 Tax=Acinetobacter thutiue TaxID=2998078 RepID=A0ABT7WSH9_9GAMM|nr:glycosyltransferase family 2 protein [Acinetobacter thutiue]MCY6413484.1 glycosyltransferase family 2 protein [Acinetobacter thutiue]MDN0015593.1 glycosyltransferase family 2 protein [Acinetobacter thutiue]